MSRTGATTGRWPMLDGLRGLMTCGVFIAHVRYDWLPGSILFMDTFFMMSSFFITRLLVKDGQRHGRIQLRQFYLRRVRRLYPALLLMVAAVTAFTYFYLDRGIDKMLHVLATLFYFENWLRAFDVPQDPILGHAWSLSIEEQFYLIWPLLLGWGLAWQRPDQTRQGRILQWVWGLVAVAVAAMLWRSYLASTGHSIGRLYNGTDMRLDSLALGALLALVFESPRVQACGRWLARPWALWPMLLIMLAGALQVDVRHMAWYQWQQPLFVLLSLGVLLAFLCTDGRAGLARIFQNPVSLYLGAICYGVYLWHYPLVEFSRDIFGLSETMRLLVCAPLTLLLASLSYHWVELPMLQGQRGSAR